MKRILLFLIIGSFVFPSCKSVYQSKKATGQYYKIDKKLDAIQDSGIIKMILPYKKQLDAIMNEVIGYSQGLTKDKPESTLGNWVADVIAKRAAKATGEKIDFGVQNYGGLRLGELVKGDITLGKIYELMPFQNYLTVITVRGDTVQQFFDRMASYGGWPVSGNVRYKIKDGKAVDIYINGAPLDPAKKYKIALPDYIANGGDKCFMLKGKPQKTTAILIRDALIDAVKEAAAKGQAVKSGIEGRTTKTQ